MGEWLSNLKDWQSAGNDIGGLRYLCGSVQMYHEHCIGSRGEMESMLTVDSEMPKELHRPYVDEVKLVCPEVLWRNEREPYVMDCWFDSGCAPFANGTTHSRMKRNSTHPSRLITSARRLTKPEGGSTLYWLLVQLSLENRHTRDVFPLAIS